MKKICFSVLLVFLLFSCTTTNERANFNNDEELITFFKDSIQEVIKEYDVKGLSVAIIKDGQLFWSSRFGYSNITEKLKGYRRYCFWNWFNYKVIYWSCNHATGGGWLYRFGCSS